MIIRTVYRRIVKNMCSRLENNTVSDDRSNSLSSYNREMVGSAVLQRHAVSVTTRSSIAEVWCRRNAMVIRNIPSVRREKSL